MVGPISFNQAQLTDHLWDRLPANYPEVLVPGQGDDIGRANRHIVWPSGVFTVRVEIAAGDPVSVTRPIVDETMVPIPLYTAPIDGAVVTHLSAELTGNQDLATKLFIYETVDINYFCIGQLEIPAIDVENADPDSPVDTLPLSPVLWKDGSMGALKLMEGSSLFCGVSLELTTPIIINITGQRYTSIWKL
jgi:hypothetical protein